MPIRALMVDVDGVIVRIRPGTWAADMHADLGLSRDVLDEQFFKPHWTDVALGRVGLHERLAPVLAEFAPHLTCETLCAYWFSKDAQLDEALLAELAIQRGAGLQLHLATIQEHLRAAYLWEKLGLRDRFDAMHYAADLGCMKTDPEFFAKVEARTGFAAPELLLLDDSPANIAAARAAGWGGALWNGTASLAEVLSSAGVPA